ncbi:TonB family protein [Hymenobacter roseosalivarius DSM 11622]|uniref:TonB family protein n=1 Tax=Hymenobacter roseosalivarius DSM 11622 TaxID=645990 RepID=A0A1W1VCF7_9BACT|nr:energy transducer TonB [Hymenobacter roseosalivarius]SMB91058.1 TonB family protein [Hymenobacter roseosalivarius DSM 11622]
MSKIRHHILATLLTLGVWVSFLSPSQVLAQPAAASADRLTAARQYLSRQEYTAASVAYQQAFKQIEGTARDYYQAARAAARNNEPKVAFKQLDEATKKGYYPEEYLRAEIDFAALTTQVAWQRVLTQAREKRRRHEARFDQKLVALVRRIGFRDQQYRLVAAEADKKYGWNSPQASTAMQQQGVIDLQLMRQVDSLIARHGYPGKSLVGEYLKSKAFLVIQHNPDEKYLPLLTAAADKSELSWASLALLIDRLRMASGKMQVYGTQLSNDDNKWKLLPIEDEANVNARRAKIGLEPLEEYLKRYEIIYQLPTATYNSNPPGFYAALWQVEKAEKLEVEVVGGYEALYAKLRYPAAARQANVSGEVTVQLLIDKAGVPQNVAIVKGLGHGCDEEALQVMRAARYINSAGQDHEIRVRLPFPYEPKATKSGQ